MCIPWNGAVHLKNIKCFWSFRRILHHFLISFRNEKGAPFQSNSLSMKVVEDPDIQSNLFLSWNAFIEDFDSLNRG